MKPTPPSPVPSPLRRLAGWVAVGASVVALAGPAHAEASGDAGGFSLVFTGDLSFAGRRVPASAAQAAGDANPLRAFAGIFEAADLAVANAEGLMTSERPPAYGESRLDIGAAPLWAGVFEAAHVDLVGLANNHAWDGGAEGVVENLANLRATGVRTMGAGATPEEAEAPYLLEREGRCVAVLPATLKSNRAPKDGAAVAYYRGDAGLDRLAGRIRALRERGCFVAVTVHMGREGVTTAPRSVVAAAHRLVDAGAGLVVGHHPHVLQGVEWRGDAAIAYSLGNFVFTNRTPLKRQTGVLAVRLSGDSPPRLEEIALLPAHIRVPSFAPTPATPSEAAALRDALADYSRPFETRVDLVDDRIVFRPRPND
ncbi:MAG: CapA family protein [Deltaproteobacteria bacterium]|nr:MAG: CapA family protein [Deltaproteobacteria bacterium]